ncbi:MAG: hypothetical protein H6621_08855 [Halobacteriovoraceae bacterium]|nr:hypothetical protein [Halobacteriovoraceae bacterium]
MQKISFFTVFLILTVQLSAFANITEEDSLKLYKELEDLKQDYSEDPEPQYSQTEQVEQQQNLEKKSLSNKSTKEIVDLDKTFERIKSKRKNSVRAQNQKEKTKTESDIFE